MIINDNYSMDNGLHIHSMMQQLYNYTYLHTRIVSFSDTAQCNDLFLCAMFRKKERLEKMWSCWNTDTYLQESRARRLIPRRVAISTRDIRRQRFSDMPQDVL